MTTIKVTTLSGQPLDVGIDDLPFLVEVSLPLEEGEDPPNTITITISSEEDTETLDLAWTGNIGSDPIYRSNPITIEDGATGGGKITLGPFEFSSGDMDGIDTYDGEPVEIAYDDASTSITIYNSQHTLVIDQVRQFFDIAEAYWKKVRDELQDVDEPEARQMVALANLKLGLIDRGREQLDNEELWDSERAAIGKLFAGWVRNADLMHDPRFEHTAIQATKANAREKSMDVIIAQVTEIVLGFYVMLAEATSVAQVYTIFTGEDVLGHKVSFSERILAALDLAANAAGEVAGALHNLKTIRRTSERIPTTPLMEGADPFNVLPGTAVDPLDFGILKQGTRHARRVADQFGVIFEIRPANLDSRRWQALGHPRKPMDIKDKTINNLDIHLGADPDNIGLVGHFRPKEPVRTPDMDDATWGQVQKRYEDRLTDYEAYHPKMQHLEEEGMIRLEDGLIIDTGLCDNTGLAITGDYDPWAIRDRATGRLLDGEEVTPIIDALRGGGFDAKHPPHLNWKPTDPNGIRVDTKIKQRHQQQTDANPDGGNEALLTIGGRADGPARTTFSDSPTVLPGADLDIPHTRPRTDPGQGRLPITEARMGAEAALSGFYVGTPEFNPVDLDLRDEEIDEDVVVPSPSIDQTQDTRKGGFHSGNLRWIVAGAGLVVVVVALAASGLFSGPEEQVIEATPTAVVQATDVDAGQVVAAEPTDTATPVPTSTATPSIEDYVLSLPVGLQITGWQLIDMGAKGQDILGLKGYFIEDDPYDWIYSIEGVEVGVESGISDLRQHTGSILNQVESAEEDIFNGSLFECGMSGERTVVCSQDVLPMPPGELVMAVMVLDEPLPEPVRPAEPGGYPMLQPGEFEHTYAFVVDTDGSPANDWVPQNPFNWDYFQGTDRWYQLIGNPSSGTWILRVTLSNGMGMASTARVVIEGNTITFYIALEELGDPEVVRYRMSTFQHDGTYAPNNASGDVSGENPTVPPIPLVKTGIELTGSEENP